MFRTSWRRGHGDGGSSRGGGNHGDGQGGRGHSMPDPPKQGSYCHYFFNTGRCRFGESCRYPHVQGKDPEDQDAEGQGPDKARGFNRFNGFNDFSQQGRRNYRAEEEGRPENYREWEQIIRRSQSLKMSIPKSTLADFFSLGLDLMDSDVGVVQEVIRGLATDKGLWLIRDVTDRQIPAATSDGVKRTVWADFLDPYFKTITHPNVEDSAMLEQQLCGIHGFLLGPGASRMKTLFGFCLSVFEQWPALYGESLPVGPLAATCGILSKILDSATANIVNNEFNAVVERLTNLLKDSVFEDANVAALRQVNKHVQYMQRRLGLGQSLPMLGAGSRPHRAAAVFDLVIDPPGDLSREGPRHDNDHADIDKIRILPTFQEIMSPRADYLPTNDPSRSHLPGVAGLIDRHFRLLREDTVGQLRDAVRFELERQQNPEAPSSGQMRNPPEKNNNNNNLRTFVYHNAIVKDAACDPRYGLELRVQCDQPRAVRELDSKRRRQEWWESSKRLQPGALVCIIDSAASVIFAVVSDELNRKGVAQNEDRGDKKKKPKHALADDGNILVVTLHLAREDCSDVTPALRWCQDLGHRQSRCLVEFPGILLASFEHTLAALQHMSQKLDVPFADILAPDNPETLGGVIDIPRPLYSRVPGFEFDLSCLTKDRTELRHSSINPTTAEILEENTTLDETQSKALLDTLNRELSCIQGPPGTGKSYTGQQIIQALLANAKKTRLGPIICVCYTNHALDQLLEHLLDDGVANIIRIGSQSKSERLQPLNLREVAKNMTRTKPEKSASWTNRNSLAHTTAEMERQIDELETVMSARTMEWFLKQWYPEIGKHIFGGGQTGGQHEPRSDTTDGDDTDGEDWEEVRPHKKNCIPRWIARGARVQTGRPPRPVSQAQDTHPEALTRHERALLHEHWLQQIRDAIIAGVKDSCMEFFKAKQSDDRVRGEVNLRCLQQAQVVGVTTTGLARNVHLLRKLRCKVVVCEEAGEVLEAHLLTALLPSVEHAILIGDHQQLRPGIQNFALQSGNPAGVRYSLDVSLFERLVDPKHALEAPRIPLSVLDTQRRMHPSISELVRSTLYPSLKDVNHVGEYPPVAGVRHRLFWFHHTHPEDRSKNQDVGGGTSHTHMWEVSMATDLASHLVRQGVYGPGNIAVLTPYLGQLRLLRKSLERRFEVDINERDLSDLEVMEADEGEASAPAAPAAPAASSAPVLAKHQPSSLTKKVGKSSLSRSIRAATVDRFQGDEADVVIISLVRSNEQRKCGFLSVSNRINVLLSRAKHGMYIIGNAETYGTVKMWRDVIGMLRAQNNIGEALELQCPRHPDTAIAVTQPDDFPRFSPDGGCGLPCNRRLFCGHACTGRCHADVMHAAVKCLEDCQRMKQGCDHSCARRCGDPCEDRCNVDLTDLSLELKCGHVMNEAKCWQSQNPQSIVCKVPVPRTVPGCDHKISVPCCADVSSATFMCEAACGSDLACGHSCKKKCWKCRPVTETVDPDGAAQVCRSTVDHGACIHICGRPYTTCQHVCRKTCHPKTACGPCEVACEVRCSHSTCAKKCCEPCVPCAEEDCASRCPHSQCSLPCAAPCDWVPCSKRCEKKLECGHRCPAVCGEICPDRMFCQTCGDRDVKDAVVDFVEMATYADIDLDEDPCIFPDCGHFFTRSNMDSMMGMGNYYKLSDTGEPVSILETRLAFSESGGEDGPSVRTCSSCRGSLRSVSRYGRMVRGAMLDDSMRRFISWSKTKVGRLGSLLMNEVDKMMGMPKPKPKPNTSAGSKNSKKLEVEGGRNQQLTQLREWVGGGRYTSILVLRNRISEHASMVARTEQPIQRVADLVQSARQRQKTKGVLVLDESGIQFASIIDGVMLLLRLDLAIFTDVFDLVGNQAWRDYDVALDPKAAIKDGLFLLREAERLQKPRQQVEAHLILAHLSNLASQNHRKSLSGLSDQPAERTTGTTLAPAPVARSKPFPTHNDTRKVYLDKVNELRATALFHLRAARALVDAFPSADIFMSEIEEAERAANHGTFYANVSAQEKRAVYATMAKEFLGTGHWYTCERGHPFTVGECGMPMERARCPECNAPVGGLNHAPDAGVRRDNEMEELARGFERL